MRKAYQMFGVRRGSGITKQRFRRAMFSVGLDLTPEALDSVFDRYDSDGSGLLNFSEFVSSIMPRDYKRKTWNAKRCEQIQHERASVSRVRPDEPNFPRSMNSFRWRPEEIERMIRQKLRGHCKRPEDQFRVSYQMFGRPKHGITGPIFERVLRRLGISLTPEEIECMMHRYDKDGSGKLDFSELCRGLMPRDYPEKSWTVKRGELIAKENKAQKLGVPCAVIDEHQDRVRAFHMARTQKHRADKEKRDKHMQQARARLTANFKRRSKRKSQKRAQSAHPSRRRKQAASSRRPGTAKGLRTRSPSQKRLQEALMYASSPNGRLTRMVEKLGRSQSGSGIGYLSLKTRTTVPMTEDTKISHHSAWR